MPARCISKTPEPGIDMTLGAKRNQFSQSARFDGLRLRPALFGISHGLLLRFAATRIFQLMLSGTSLLIT